MKRYLYILFVLLIASSLLFPQAVSAGKLDIQGGTSSIYFKIDHQVGFNSGFIQSFNGTVRMDKEKLKGFEIKADTGSLTTFFEARDVLLKSETFFDVEQFPEILLRSQKINSMQVLTDLTFKGITKPVILEYAILRQGQDEKGKERVTLALSGMIDRREFGIEYNKNTEDGKPGLGNHIQLLINIEGAAK